jgi:hypothetical protein
MPPLRGSMIRDVAEGRTLSKPAKIGRLAARLKIGLWKKRSVILRMTGIVSWATQIAKTGS